jgi:hypothetical protein
MASTAMMAVLQYLTSRVMRSRRQLMTLRSAVRSTRSPASSRLPSLTGASSCSPAMAEVPPMRNISPERLLSRFDRDRPAVAALAFTTDSSALIAVGNDYGNERLFERQIMGLGCSGDVFIAISTSGQSPNIIPAIDAARQGRLVTIGFTGRSGGEMALRCDLCLRASSDSTPLIQQIHITAAHIICGLVEKRLFPLWI